MLLRKTFVLQSTDSSMKKAVCNVEKKKEYISGEVRLYNFNDEPEGILTLGLLDNNKVYKAGLTQKTKMHYVFNSEEKINLETLSIALLQIKDANVKPLLFGNANNLSESENTLINSLSILDVELKPKEIEKKLDENRVYLEEQDEIESKIDEEYSKTCDCDEKCSGCKYREAFYQEEITEKTVNFIEDIKNQLDYLFEKYPQEEFLAQIFPHSKWAKVDYDNTGEYYVVGVIYENDAIKYVCYGIPGVYSETPPAELKGFTKWLPLDTESPQDFGYWLSYQDAESGENIEINIV